MKAAERRDLSWGALARFAGLAALAVVTLLAVTWVIASRLASREAARAERRVVARRIELEKLPPPRPRAAMPPEARQAVVEAAQSAGRLVAPFQPPKGSPGADLQQAELWLNRQLILPTETIERPPASVRALTEGRRPALERLLAALKTSGGVVEGEPPPALLGASDALLLDAVVLQHDGRGAEAARRVEAAWDLAEAWLDQAPLARRWQPSRELQHALIAARKVPVPASRASALDMTALRARAARSAATRAAELVALARHGSAEELLAEWPVEPTWTRRLLAPLYRRRVASSSAVLADRAASLAEGLVAETDDARQARLRAYSLPPLESSSGLVHDLAVGVGLADLTESRWDVVAFEEAEAARDLLFIVEDWEITRRVLLLRSRRDASPDGAWPPDLGDLAASEHPWLHFSTSVPGPGRVSLHLTNDSRPESLGGPRRRLVFESAPR